jgi:hypothetical protein
MQSFYEVEKKSTSPSNGTTMADIYSFFYKDQAKIKFISHKDTDAKGLDIELGQPAESMEFCKERCLKHPQCISFSFVGGNCWMKDGIPSREKSEGGWTGYFPHKFKC